MYLRCGYCNNSANVPLVTLLVRHAYGPWKKQGSVVHMGNNNDNNYWRPGLEICGILVCYHVFSFATGILMR